MAPVRLSNRTCTLPVVIDSSGQKLAFVYHHDEPSRRAAAKLPSKDQTRQIAANIAKLPELLGKA